MPEKKSYTRSTIVFVVITVFTFSGWYLTRSNPVEVELVTVSRGFVEEIVVNTRAGTIKACHRSNLAPALGGQISKLWVKEGDRVKQGQALLELWNVDLVAQRELAQRQLAITKERRREACITASNARRESVRSQQLFKRGFVSSQSFGDANANANARQAGCDAAISDIKRAQAQIQVAVSGLERTILYAPFAGIIAKITGELGEFTTPSPPGVSTPPAIDLIDDSCLYVSAPMDEVDAPKIKIGQTARITLDAMPGQSFNGIVRRIAPYVTEIEKQARTVDVEVDFNDVSTQAFLVGYSADIEIIIRQHDDVLRIPTQALQQDNNVFVMDSKSKLQQRHLKIGFANWGFTEIISGLSKGDQVLSSFDQDNLEVGTYIIQKRNQP